MSTKTTTTWGYQATTGAVARSRWCTEDAARFASRHASAALAATAAMPSNPVVNKVNEHHGIRHRPPEDS